MTKTRSRWIWLCSVLLAVAAPAREAASFDVLVSSGGTGQITQIDGATGVPEGVFVLPGTEGLSAAAGLRLGADGQLYVGSNGSVDRLDGSTGVLVDKLETGLPGTGYFLALAADGSVFSNAFYGNQVVRFVGGSEPPSYIGEPPLVPTGLDIGPDGNLFVGDFDGNRVMRFNASSGASLGVFCTIPIAGQAGAAGATRFGPDGRLYVALYSGGDIVRCDGTTGAYLGPFIPAGDRHPAFPSHLAWGPDGNLYVAASGSGEVLRYDGTTGAFLGAFASGLGSLWGIEFVPDLEPLNLLPAVDTTSGPVQGFLVGGVKNYKGIPYAEAPTGTLRWKRPERKAAAQSPIAAITNGPQCPQLSGSVVIGDEDCLKISLWAPPNDPNAPPLPVLFYIHGGGLWTGSNSGPVTDGSAIALAQNAIVVEPQYRLGALGFLGLPQLAAEDPNGSTGNYGFLDQLEALRWVRDNIAAFGGDPNQVTIAGQSAGGWSVCALMASPLSDGLFRAGIVQSGECMNARPLTLPAGSSVLSDPFFGDTVYERGEHVVSNAGCEAASDKLGCLRSASTSTLVQAYAALPRNLLNQVEQPVNPAIDGYVLSEQPVVMLRQGAADGRALMIGTTANESTHFSEGWDAFFTTPAIYDAAVRAALGNTRADALLPLYPAASYTPIAEALRTLVEDAGMVCPTLDTADAAAAGGSAAWVYHLTFEPNYGSSPQFWRRTFHNLDLYYVFGTYARLTPDYGIVIGPDDAALSVSMQNAWGSFVRTGVPTTTPAWPQYAPATPGDLASVSVLNFDVPNSTVSGAAFRAGRCAPLVPVANQLDPDRDVAVSGEDNCPVITNTSQADVELDAVGDVCDNCTNVANPRVAAGFLDANPWATLTGGQRDDDHDGYGNKCDAKFVGAPSQSVGGLDLGQFRASNNEDRRFDTCGTSNTRPCAIFDLDEAAAGNAIGGLDLGRFRQLNNATPGLRCAACTGTGSVALPCTAGTAGSCN